MAYEHLRLSRDFWSAPDRNRRPHQLRPCRRHGGPAGHARPARRPHPQCVLRRGLAATGYYHATKFTVEGPVRVVGRGGRATGICVTIIEPGGVRTTIRQEPETVRAAGDDQVGRQVPRIAQAYARSPRSSRQPSLEAADSPQVGEKTGTGKCGGSSVKCGFTAWALALGAPRLPEMMLCPCPRWLAALLSGLVRDERHLVYRRCSR